MKYMTINNRKVAFDDEKMCFLLSEKRELICRHSVIILNFLLMAPAVCVW